MNFQEFVGASEVHLRMTGWLMHGHNGVWRKYKKPGAVDVHPLPAAVVKQLEINGLFEPTVETYLTSNGWRRTTGGVIAGWPMFVKNNKFRSLPIAMLEQLRDDRLDKSIVDPHTTPSGMREIITTGLMHRDNPPPSSNANTAPARR